MNRIAGIITLIIVILIVIASAIGVSRYIEQRSIDPEQSEASNSPTIWDGVKPATGRIYPWTNGGPTTGWESFSANFVYICNGKYCWVYDRGKSAWNNSGNAIALDTNADYKDLKPTSNGLYPWSNNGPTSAWTWVTKVNNQDVNETMLCNGNYCWRYLRYTQGTGSGWRDNGSPIHLPTYNDVWKDSRVSALWSGNGITVAWTDPINSQTTFCNKSDCRSIDTKTWQWRFNGQSIKPFPDKVTEINSAWTSPVTNVISQCVKNTCWLFNIQTGKYNTTPEILTTTSTEPAPKSCTSNSNCGNEEICNAQKVCEPIVCAAVAPNECQTNQRTPHTCNYIPKTNGTACGNNGTCQNGTCTALGEGPQIPTNIWDQLKPAPGNIYPGTNGGPTAGWESYAGNTAYICNGKYCWSFNRTTLSWNNNGSPIALDTNADYKDLKPTSNGVYPWSNNGPTSAWTWILKMNNQDVNETILCNGNNCWRYLRYPNGVSGSGWRDNGNPINLSNYNDTWKDSRIVSLWEGNGITAAWTDPVNSYTTFCNKANCRSLDYKNWQWRFNGQSISPAPFPSGVSQIDAAWTSPVTNIITMCAKNICWSFNIQTGKFDTNTITLPTSTVATVPLSISTFTTNKTTYKKGEDIKVTLGGTAPANSTIDSYITIDGGRSRDLDTIKANGSAQWSANLTISTNDLTVANHTIRYGIRLNNATAQSEIKTVTITQDTRTRTNCQGDHTVCNANERCIDNTCTSNTTLACTQIPTGKSASCLNITISNRTCNYGTNKPNGTACGTNMICTNGQCVNNATPSSYSSVRALGINIKLEDRAFPATYKYPNTFIGVWREDGNNSKFLTYKVVDLTAGKTYDDPQFFNTNGTAYTLGENDYLVVKPESYLSKIHQLKTLSIANNKLQLNDANNYFAGDTRVDSSGRFDRVTVSDYNYFKQSNAYGNSNKYDYYYLNYYVNTTDNNPANDYQINIQDVVKFRNNMGKNGETEKLHPSIVPAIQEILNGKLYRVVEIK